MIGFAQYEAIPFADCHFCLRMGVVFIENEISDIDGNYASKHDKLVTKHV